jgi:undecaprenyl-diphosphatase
MEDTPLPQTGDPTRSSPGHDLAIRALLLVGAAAALAGLLAVLGFGLVGTHGHGVVQGWDDIVGRWFVGHRHGLVGVSKVIGFLGDAPVLAVIVVAITVGLLLAGQRMRAAIPLVAYLGGEFLVYVTRAYLHRPRPVSANYPAPGAVPGVHEVSVSFPSGHATSVSAVVIGLAGLTVITWKVRWPWIIAGVLVLAVAGSRLVLGVHWFSDVTAGLTVGVLWGLTVVYVLADAPWPWTDGDREPTPVEQSPAG